MTRAASEDNLGTDVTSQILRYPQILLITAAVLALFGLVPGMPTIPFLIIALLLWWLTTILRREQKEKVETAIEEQAAAQEQVAYKPENVLSLLAVDPMEVEIGYSLIPLVDKSQGGDLFERVSLIRRQVALELGIILPAIRIRDNMQLSPNQYLIKIKGVEVASGELITHSYLAMDAGAVTEKVSGIPTKNRPLVYLPCGLRRTKGKKRKCPVIRWWTVLPFWPRILRKLSATMPMNYWVDRRSKQCWITLKPIIQ